eukprot:5067723-Pyramimonas_sp.AAC.1
MDPELSNSSSEGPRVALVSCPRPTTRSSRRAVTGSGLLTAKHVDDINMAATEDTIDKCVKFVEEIFGKCKLNKHTCTNCAVRYTKDVDGNVSLDQDEYIQQLRPIRRPELTGEDAGAKASKVVADVFASLRVALAHALITQV